MNFAKIDLRLREINAILKLDLNFDLDQLEVELLKIKNFIKNEETLQKLIYEENIFLLDHIKKS